MMSQKPRRPDRRGVSSRLKKALSHSGLGVRALSRRVTEEVKSLGGEKPRGTSYGAIYGYVEGTGGAPNVGALRLIAIALGVREEWLIWDDGEMTEAAQRIAAAHGLVDMPSKEESPADFLLARIDLVFPEYELLPQEAKLLALAALTRFSEAVPDHRFDETGAHLPDDFNIFWMSLRNFLLPPLLVWGLPDGASGGENPWEAAVGRIDWSSRRVRDYLLAALAAYSQAVPGRATGQPAFFSIVPHRVEERTTSSVELKQIDDG
jgi:hypothetical protein